MNSKLKSEQRVDRERKNHQLESGEMGWNVEEVRDWKSGGTVGGRRYKRKQYEVGNGIHWASERIRG